MNRLRVLLVIGTRPEAIKMAPVYWALCGNGSGDRGVQPSQSKADCQAATVHSARCAVHALWACAGRPLAPAERVVGAIPHLAPGTNRALEGAAAWGPHLSEGPAASEPHSVEPLVVLSGQHLGLVEPAMEYFGLPVDARCEVMTPAQSLARLSARLLEELDRVVDRTRPECMVVQGDTATAHAGALVAHWRRIPLVHVEAGLRSGDLRAPWPEEANRRAVDMLADLWCAPTERARQTLLAEGADRLRVHRTGNTVIDALHQTLRRERSTPSFDRSKYAFLDDRPLVLVTCHRRENLRHGITRVCLAVDILAERLAHYQFVWLLHPNPRAQSAPKRMLTGRSNVRLLPPVPYPEFVWLMDRADLLISDSGGVQEEAPSLGKPVVVTRQTTERVEAIEAGTALLAGTMPRRIADTAARLVGDRAAYAACQVAVNPYGDGLAGQRIAALIARQAWKIPPLLQPDAQDDQQARRKAA